MVILARDESPLIKRGDQVLTKACREDCIVLELKEILANSLAMVENGGSMHIAGSSAGIAQAIAHIAFDSQCQ